MGFVLVILGIKKTNTIYIWVGSTYLVAIDLIRILVEAIWNEKSELDLDFQGDVIKDVHCTFHSIYKGK